MSSNAVEGKLALTREQVAVLVKNGRLKKQLTQKELSILAGISLRSLQRIENAEVLPRLYTLRQLGEHIEMDLHDEPQTSSSFTKPIRKSSPRKWILSISSLVVIILSFSAYVIQSPTFPETLFETLNMVLAGIIIYSVILYSIWK